MSNVPMIDIVRVAVLNPNSVIDPDTLSNPDRVDVLWDSYGIDVNDNYGRDIVCPYETLKELHDALAERVGGLPLRIVSLARELVGDVGRDIIEFMDGKDDIGEEPTVHIMAQYYSWSDVRGEDKDE